MPGSTRPNCQPTPHVQVGGSDGGSAAETTKSDPQTRVQVRCAYHDVSGVSHGVEQDWVSNGPGRYDREFSNTTAAIPVRTMTTAAVI
jgi:hypothetical protein